jgi:hypothetical protein
MTTLNVSKNTSKSISTKMSLNNSQKLLTGFLALVMVAGMTSPAFAQEARDAPSITNDVDFGENCPDECYALALETTILNDPGFCEGGPDGQPWDGICQQAYDYYLEVCLETSSEDQCTVGGTVGSMSTTSLLVAGAQSNMGMWSLALVGIVGAAAAITYKVKSKSEQ